MTPADPALVTCVCVQVKPGTPVLMCSVPGYDASGLVRDLAAEQNKHITSISIGKSFSPATDTRTDWENGFKTLD